MSRTSVWTNAEDEVLKASISKYGLQEWARVSSLLSRKSAKQCKARWLEYLDPSLNHQAWTAEEDAQLLHLARVLPSSWRTISTMLSRPASQLLARYQTLLDESERREAGEFGLTGIAGGEAAAPSADDVRKLRVGEIDPDPETKPAKPDAVDMDEEDKEMLSEARARLANTQGKKAKRKARERMLDESRRVALLQKRRELKMSGINIKIRTTKKGQTDYNADVPFERPIPEGFYDVADELDRNEREKAAFDPKKQNLANKRKGNHEDDGDEKKRKKTDKKDGPSISAQAMRAAQLQKIREAERDSKRTALSLPAPQVTESELEQVVKLGRVDDRVRQSGFSEDDDATRGLVGKYNNMLGATPIRTPRAAPEEDRVAIEARNLRALRETQSSILGGETPDQIEHPASSSGAGSMAPPGRAIVTPNPMATPFRQSNGIEATPGPGAGTTPMRTPRDSFSLNKNAMIPVGQTPREFRQQEKGMRNTLLAKLAALPKPKAVEFEFEAPEEQLEIEKMRSDLGEDASLRDARNELLRKAQELAEFKRETQVIQRRLPRPKAVDLDALMKSAESIADENGRAAAIETALLIANDVTKYAGGSGLTGAVRSLQLIDDEAMHKARELVADEVSNPGSQKQKQEFVEAWTELHTASKLPGLDGYYEDEVDEHQLMVETFDTIEEQITLTATNGNELEKKLGKLQKGYMIRSTTLKQKIVEAGDALENIRISLNTALSAQVGEEAAIPRRLEQLRDELSFVSRREREAQEQYRLVRDEMDGLPATNGYH